MRWLPRALVLLAARANDPPARGRRGPRRASRTRAALDNLARPTSTSAPAVHPIADPTGLLTNKVTLWRRLAAYYGRDAASALAPATYDLSDPSDVELLRADHAPGRAYVVKNGTVHGKAGLAFGENLDWVLGAKARGFEVAQVFERDATRVRGRAFSVRAFVRLACDGAGGVVAGLHRELKCLYGGDAAAAATTNRGSPDLPLRLADLCADLDIDDLGGADPAAVAGAIGAVLGRVVAAAAPGLCAGGGPAARLLGADLLLAGSPKVVEFNAGPRLTPADRGDFELKRRVVRDFFAAADPAKRRGDPGALFARVFPP
ncbi:hypothetical protein AURANDRAFT_66317 [Aureococcus anophagefferens]|uniref:Uncharacterized protein n=1 Tax=Aureococcus anophagefferens TaxID=44056 RepID=F0YGX2_AURAN|nr:hypothetical protein AURANDRAFT_66317 [Aureococcus anophagefferens]EGB05615.1 hypothetical protein AURANDRAFT_66317 [Aureococcus anophagefferens]|eukprot:XP_009039746.1 hypothetical protein AURANDRAFT_66317 [Aureococcus anophagefferens]